MTEPIREQIEFELDQLQGVASLAAQLSSMDENERRPWDAAAAAKIVADLPAGLENLCKRRMKYLEQEVPQGPQSHAEILRAFLEAEDFRDLFDGDFALRLKKYLRFRHRFIHGYGHQVDWEIVDEPLRLLPDTINRLTNIWQHWLESLLDEPE